MGNYDIFISYRREGGFETANLIASKLKLSGYRVFLDIHSMHSGDFSEQLKEKVQGCKDFVWVLSPTNLKNEDGSFTRIDTWVRHSSVPRPVPPAHAMSTQRFSWRR